MEPIRVLHVVAIMNRGGLESMIMNHYRQIDRTDYFAVSSPPISIWSPLIRETSPPVYGNIEIHNIAA